MQGESPWEISFFAEIITFWHRCSSSHSSLSAFSSYLHLGRYFVVEIDLSTSYKLCRELGASRFVLKANRSNFFVAQIFFRCRKRPMFQPGSVAAALRPPVFMPGVCLLYHWWCWGAPSWIRDLQLFQAGM